MTYFIIIYMASHLLVLDFGPGDKGLQRCEEFKKTNEYIIRIDCFEANRVFFKRSA